MQDGDPILFWECMKTNALVSELAEFAIVILSIVINTAGNEHQFSGVKVTKDRLRNCLRLQKLKSNLREQQYADGLHDVQGSRKNHSEEHIQTLLEVPWYESLLAAPQDSHDFIDTQSGWSRRGLLVNTQKKWRVGLKKWMDEAKKFDDDSDDNLKALRDGQEAEDEIPDDGELEGSGDEYEA
ncbi:hypothetical protein K435DRAFT_812244 [Dendrothele bispora CBS 962.96]|uniref:Uncharacterized protein n=1 Tax=Dendrothele bispora (strain CBS 962.96) TaxID=1314807 RepID=A0A4S8KQ21_DENBC|nr:hypothetical protein K435DRAFT_812244 [Dendrothele bispora CBS 962.96]